MNQHIFSKFFEISPKGANIGLINMLPNTLAYVIVSQGVIKDSNTNTPSYTNISDLFTIPTGKTETIESFFVAGKILNTAAGFTKVEVAIFDPNENSLYTEEASGTLIAGDFTFSVNFKLKSFSLEGKYQIRVKVNGSQCEDGNKYYFFVKKLL